MYVRLEFKLSLLLTKPYALEQSCVCSEKETVLPCCKDGIYTQDVLAESSLGDYIVTEGQGPFYNSFAQWGKFL